MRSSLFLPLISLIRGCERFTGVREIFNFPILYGGVLNFKWQSENTKKILDILAEYDAKATFFITGANEQCRPYIKEAYDAGHTIGLHTYTHNYDEVYESDDAYFADLEKVGEVAKEQIGFVPCFIRFPGGSSNMVSAQYNKGIMTRLVKSVQEKGYQYYDWNLDSGDAAGYGKEEIEQNATTDKIDHVMILFHDTQTKDPTVEALPYILKYYTDLGYEFRGIDRDSYVSHHSVQNWWKANGRSVRADCRK